MMCTKYCQLFMLSRNTLVDTIYHITIYHTRLPNCLSTNIKRRRKDQVLWCVCVSLIGCVIYNEDKSTCNADKINTRTYFFHAVSKYSSQYNFIITQFIFHRKTQSQGSENIYWLMI